MIQVSNTEAAALRDISELLSGANLASCDQSWPSVIEQLDRMRELEDGWDDEGSPAPETALVEDAIRFAQLLEAMRHPPSPFPPE